MENIFYMRKYLYKITEKVDINSNYTLIVSNNTLRVDLLCNGLKILSQFLVPYKEIKHFLDKDFVKDIENKCNRRDLEELFIFTSFTIADNILKLNLPYKKTNFLNNNLPFDELYSITLNIGRYNVLEMYRGFYDMIKKYNIPIKKIGYIKIHRLTNPNNSVNIVDIGKFINLLERK